MKKVQIVVALLVGCGLVLSGCETTGQSAGAGALVGALAGGIIGHQSGNAAEGAAIGAALGAGIGAIVGHERQRRLATKAEVEQEYIDAGQPVPTTPTIYWDNYDLQPTQLRPGDELVVRGNYVVVGPPPPTPPQGNIYWKRGDQIIETGAVEDINEGRSEFEKTYTIPPSMQDGMYVLEVELVNGESVSQERRQFLVASAE